MQLLYIDESGINYRINNGMFNDGPNIIYGALCVDDRKYFHLERLFLEIINEYFGIYNWQSIEVHASEIWNQKGQFAKYDKSKITSFFDEIVQVLSKLNIFSLISYYPKTKNANHNLMMNELKYAIYSFFHNIEMHLSEVNDTGILISDKQCIKTESGDFLLSKMFYDRTTWRTNPKAINESILRSKFKYESMSCFMLDNIHYVDSKLSLFNQISDIIIYIFQRLLTYMHLYEINPTLADENKLPTTLTSIRFYSEKLAKLTTYDLDDNDVIFDEFADFFDFKDTDEEDDFEVE
ncbi:MAG: DUF3800 domain-containing protein [Spirochaetes bacterium]|nr:DUF3800 domain-containing protein [Spirochaetota bacterium]